MKKARGLVVGLLGVGIAFVVALFSFTPVGGSFEERISLPWLFRVRGSIDPPAEIVIVALNKQSAAYLALSPDTRTWPRSLHAQLIHNLVEAGASVIVFDVAFKESRSKEEDDALAAAIAGARRVISTNGVSSFGDPRSTRKEKYPLPSCWSR
jgi:adenylate cyclase